MKSIFPNNFVVRVLVVCFLLLNVILVLYISGVTSSKSLALLNKINLHGDKYPEISHIQSGEWDFQKLVQFFQDLADKKGGAYAYKALTFAAAKNYLPPNVDTHLLGHEVGEILYKQKGISGIEDCTDDLRNACSHSVVVGFLIDHGEGSLPEAVTACHKAPGGYGAYTMCIHGLGHGVLGYTEYDMRKAVSLCEKTGTQEYHNEEIGQCVGGVMMEMVSGVHDREAWLKQKPNYFKDNDPLAPCDMDFVPKDSRGFCYSYLTPHLFELAGASLGSPDPALFGKAMNYCNALAKDDVNRNACVGNFGKEYVVLANARNIQSVESMSDEKLLLVYNWCNLGPKDAVLPCVGSALGSLYWGGENDPGVSVRFCKIIPDLADANYCFQNLFKTVAYYIRDNDTYKESFCGQVPDMYRKDCNLKLLNNK